MTFRSILCPIDFSRHSRTALRYAESIVSRADGRLSVLCVVDPLLVMGTLGLTGAKKLLLGSTTQGLLERATVPVLAIPRRASRRAWPR